MDAAYWRQHVLAPVQFGPSLQLLRAFKFDVFLEIGPRPVLAALWRKADTPRTGSWLPSLRRAKSDRLQMMETVGDLFVRGLGFDARALELPARRRKVALPTYPFERARFWADMAIAPGVRRGSADSDQTDVSPVPKVDEWFYELRWEPAARTRQAAAVHRHVSAPGPGDLRDRHVSARPWLDVRSARGDAYRVSEGPAFLWRRSALRFSPTPRRTSAR